MAVEQKNLVFSGRGKILVATYGTKVFRWIGDCSGLLISLVQTKVKDKESYSGLDRVQRIITRGGEGTWQATCKSFSPKNLAAVLHSSHQTVNSGSVSNEVFPTGLTTGGNQIVSLAHQKVSNFVLVDSTGTPVTLTANTHYRLNADHGSVEILSVTDLTQPLKANYNYASREGVGMFTAAAPALAVRFEGLNVASSTGALEPVLVEIYKTIVDPLEALALIQSEVATFNFGGEMLLDDTIASDAALGQMGAIQYLS